MSGGSYNYLVYATDLEDLLTKRNDLEAMADRLDGLSELEFPGSRAAARATRALLVRMNLWEAHAGATMELLGPTWKAIEWWDSCDWGPDTVKKTLAELIGKEPPGEQEEVAGGDS